MAEPRQSSVDEYLSKRKQSVGKAESGREVVFKGFKAPPSYDETTRSADFIMSSERIDRDGDIVRQRGMSVVEFKKNPQGLLFHSSRTWPVGQWSDIKKLLKENPARTEGKFNFLPAGGPIAEVEQANWMVQHGAIRTVSIGFMPIDLDIIDHGEDAGTPWPWGFDIKTSELYECSLVPIPAQPDAHVKGMIDREEMAAAREFVEQALDDWAKDPRTGMLIPKKELGDVYARYFGKQGPVVMGVDLGRSRDQSALVKVEQEIEKLAETHGLKQPLTVTTEPAGSDDAGVDAVSGIQINISIAQDGTTGSNTRTGPNAGDANAGGGQDGGAGSATRGVDLDLAKRKNGILQRVGQMLGLSSTDQEEKPSDPAPRTIALTDARKAVEAAERRLQ